MIDWWPGIRRLTESLAALSCPWLAVGGTFHPRKVSLSREYIVGLEMSKSKSAPLSIVCGAFITIALTCAAFLIDNQYCWRIVEWDNFLNYPAAFPHD
jgi:hypothetical protein